MIEVLLLAIALAMDAFAVSIGLGAKSQQQNPRYTLRLAIYAALYFGAAQGVMPLIGYLLGAALLGWLATAAPWIGGFILIGLGSKMLYEVFLADEEETVDKGLRVNYEAASINDSRKKNISHRTMFTNRVKKRIDCDTLIIFLLTLTHTTPPLTKRSRTNATEMSTKTKRSHNVSSHHNLFTQER